jgi:multiple sugar transport system permease protein
MIFTMKRALSHIPIIIGSVLMLYPLIWLLSSSFKHSQDIFRDQGLWSESFTMFNYIHGWQGIANTPFYVFFQNSLIISGLAIIGNVISCSLAAYAFSRLRFSFKKVMFAFMLLTMMLPFHVVLIPQYIMFNQLGWVNSFLPLTAPKFFATEGFFIFLMVQFMRNLPKELDQAATVDGCGPVQTYWRLILPLSLPALVTTAIFTFIWTWNDFFSQLIYLSDVTKLTVALGLRLFLDSTSESQWGAMFAMSVLSIIPIFMVFVFFQKYLVEGITAGGVKG